MRHQPINWTMLESTEPKIIPLTPTEPCAENSFFEETRKWGCYWCGGSGLIADGDAQKPVICTHCNGTGTG